MTTAIYAGSFDPPTKGHQWVIEKASELFDRLFILVAVNPTKKTLLSFESRCIMLDKMCIEIGSKSGKNSNIVISTLEEGKYLADYAKDINATHLVRGIRNIADFEYEKTMKYINYDINPNLETVFLIPPKEISDISSSLIKSLMGQAGWEELVKKYISEPCYYQFLIYAN